jgi:hypothetical protein
MPRKSTSVAKYQNNPFFVAADGISLIFNLARGLGVVLIVISVFGSFDGNLSDKKDWNEFGRTLGAWTAADWLIAAASITIILLAVSLIFALFSGASSYASWQLSQGRKVSIKEAFSTAFDHLWSYLLLQLIIFGKLFLWTLLFILPGIYMTFRYSLAGVVFFDEKKKLRGNDAIKESLRLTKGAWLTTFASNMLFNLLTFGMLSNLIATGANAVLYRQFDDLGNKEKPKAHWLSWVTLAIPIVVLVLVVIFAIALVLGIAIGALPG